MELVREHAGNSGAEIALDVAAEHRTTLVGPDAGQIPVDMDGWLAAAMDPLIWFAANHILTIDNPFGRKGRARLRGRAVPVELARPKVLRAAGVERVFSRAVGVRDGLPLLDDGRIVDATNVIWCTGFRHTYAWLDLPILGHDGWPREDHGVVAGVPGLYFVGLPFQRAMASSLLGGVGHDAAAVVGHLAARTTATAGRPIRPIATGKPSLASSALEVGRRPADPGAEQAPPDSFRPREGPRGFRYGARRSCRSPWGRIRADESDRAAPHRTGPPRFARLRR
jgi:putative flavoprotein involved in K+ transport